MPITRTTQLNSGAVFTIDRKSMPYKMERKPWDPPKTSIHSEREASKEIIRSWGRDISSAEDTNQSINSHARGRSYLTQDVQSR